MGKLVAQAIFEDAAQAAALVAKSSWKRTLTAWLSVPFGLVLIMLIIFGVHSLISISSVSFPASVACMIGSFFSLILSQSTLGDKKTKWLVGTIEVPCGFALRYINSFFCPAFVTLPLSPSISGVEVAKIIAVFIIGYFAMSSFTAYFVRGSQLLLGTSKRAVIERAEEMGNETDSIPSSQVRHSSEVVSESPMDDLSGLPTPPDDSPSPSPGPTPPADNLQTPLKAQNPEAVKGTGGPPVPSPSPEEARLISTPLRHDPPPLTRPQRWAAFMSSNLDLLSYAASFISVGIPVYYGAGYAMPIQSTSNTLLFLGALRFPPKYKKFLHPVLVSSAFSILGIWVSALIRGDSLDDGIQAYETSTKYTQLWDGDTSLKPPGAGDMFSSVSDVSIVASGLPMFQYRKELKARFMTIVIPNISLSIGSSFIYPLVCHAIGISGTRSSSFASRSSTLALATPATQNLGGDSYTVAPSCIFSGIMGVVVGPWALKKMRIPEDDYITRGVTLGANSSAVATALLLTTDPRAAAFSSSSMGLFGTITVALTSVPPSVNIIRGLVGLG